MLWIDNNIAAGHIQEKIENNSLMNSAKRKDVLIIFEIGEVML